jgi:hypothetical protein
MNIQNNPVKLSQSESNGKTQKGNTFLIIAIIVGIIAIGAVGFVLGKYYSGSELEENGSKITKPLEEEEDLSSKASATEDWKTYENKEYGFEIILFDSWKGYSVLEETWNGVTLDGKDTRFKGPQIIIRHPEWTLNHPWQDIPIMVFTNEEWKLVEAKKLNVSAAPIGPRKLDQNQNYVFALPPRWVGFTDNLGQNEATEIIKTFKAFQIKDETASIKILSPNGGEKLTVGETYNIIWDCPNNSKTDVVDIYIQDERLSDKGIIIPTIGSLVKCSLEKYSWQIKDISPGENCFKIQLRHIAGSAPLIDESDNYFSIKANKTPSVKVLSPNGGEKWKIGSKQTIKWNTQNIPLTDKIAIHIRKIRSPGSSGEGQECDPIIFTELKNDGKEDWIISKYPEGNYIIEVVSYESIPITKSIKDESDTYFQIVK